MTRRPKTSAGDETALTEQVGERLRDRRREKGLSARELAEAIGVSPSMISMIENGRTNPSVGTLIAIVSALGTSLDSLFWSTPDPAPGDGDGPVAAVPEAGLVRADQRPTISLASGVQWERLTPTQEEGVSFMHVRYEVGGESCPADALHRHAGRDYVVLLEGRLGVQVGFEQYELAAGDSIAFDAPVPHRLWTIGDEPAVAIVVVIGREVAAGAH
jgi:transcriptional regulator with XRE-family HTH domain